MPAPFDAAAALDFTGKVVLVTGSSRGIGAAMVAAFAAAGARCAVNYVAEPSGKNEADAQHVFANLPRPQDAMMVECDVADHAAAGRMVERVRSHFGGLDVLVNNAGVLRDRTIRKMTPADWQAVLNVNLTGAFNCLQHAAGAINPNGRIVNVSSVSGLAGFFGQANYAASKAGLIALTKVAARELARQQVTVNAIAPGFIDTDMSRTMPEDVTRRFVEQIPLGRVGTVDDVVNAALFLCSPLAAYVTGQVLHVNGGFYMP